MNATGKAIGDETATAADDDHVSRRRQSANGGGDFFVNDQVGRRHVLREAGDQIAQPGVGPLDDGLDGAFIQVMLGGDFFDQFLVPGRPVAGGMGIEAFRQPLRRGIPPRPVDG